MPNIMNTGSFSTLTSRDYSKIFFDNYIRQPNQWQKLAKVMTMDGAYLKEGDMAGLSVLQAMNEGGEIHFEGFQEGYQKTITPINYGLGVQITSNMREDDRTGHMKKLVAELGKATNYSLEIAFWDLCNSGFTTVTALDAVALFGDSHKRIGTSSTIDNNGTAASLSQTSLQAMYNHFNTLVNDKGVPIVMKPNKLIIPPALIWKAEELLLSEYNSENANSQYNSLRARSLTYMPVNYLTSTTAWFAFAPEHDLRWYWRRKPTYTNNMDFNTDNELHKVTARYVPTAVHWRGSYGNAGA